MGREVFWIGAMDGAYSPHRRMAVYLVFTSYETHPAQRYIRTKRLLGFKTWWMGPYLIFMGALTRMCGLNWSSVLIFSILAA